MSRQSLAAWALLLLPWSFSVLTVLIAASFGAHGAIAYLLYAVIILSGLALGIRGILTHLVLRDAAIFCIFAVAAPVLLGRLT